MITILNDIHLGAVRSGGTTPATALALRQQLQADFAVLVDEVIQDPQPDHVLLILGDLFDTASVPLADLLQAWQTLRGYCQSGKELVLVAGNHDLSKTASNLSSFQMLSEMLKVEFGEAVVVVEEPTTLEAGGLVHIIPHLQNQDLFNAALAEVPAGTKYLLLHCNFDNGFAAESDHSLNLSKEQALACPAERILLGHEHQRSEHLDGKVLAIGNQMPSSVADCLGNNVKYKAVLHADKIELVPTWVRESNYAEIDWRELKPSLEVKEFFIRVTGTASAAEASDVVTAISKFRNKSSALVVTNAVSIEGVQDAEALKLNMEEVKAFDVLSALLDFLDEKERETVKKLLAAAA